LSTLSEKEEFERKVKKKKIFKSKDSYLLLMENEKCNANIFVVYFGILM